MAMFVLPAPVGAQTSRFVLLWKAAPKMRLCTRLRVLQDSGRQTLQRGSC